MHRTQRPGNAARTVALGIALVLTGRIVTAEEAPKPAPGASAAEAKPPARPPERGPRPGDVQKVFVLRNESARNLASVLRVFPAYVVEGGTSLAVSASPAVLAAIEETIKRLDVPPPPKKSVEVTGWVLEALGKSDSVTQVPAELEGAVTQLKRTFGYSAYRLADTLIVRGRVDSTMQTESLGDKSSSPGANVTYRFYVARVGVSPGDPAVIRLDRTNFRADVPRRTLTFSKESDTPAAGWTNKAVSIDGDFDIREGQRVVVGKIGLGDDGGNALILVLSAKVVD